MDLKRQSEFQETISYNEIIMIPQDIGNINYSYIVRTYGFSSDVLRFGAGAYQSYEHYDNGIAYIEDVGDFKGLHSPTILQKIEGNWYYYESR